MAGYTAYKLQKGGEMLYSQYALDKQNNRDYLLKVFQNIQFLGKE